MNGKQAELTETLVADLKKGALTAGRAARRHRRGRRGEPNPPGPPLPALQHDFPPLPPCRGSPCSKGGCEQELSSDPEEWPYQSVLDAIAEGWRVISFPDMSLLTLSADEFHGLGFLFVLERWSQ